MKKDFTSIKLAKDKISAILPIDNHKLREYFIIMRNVFKIGYEDLADNLEKRTDLFVADIAGEAKNSKIAGYITILILFLFFIVWGFLAPLESAVVGEGTVVVDTNKRTVQHLEGGIIKEILVKNGDLVKEGQHLITLEGDTAQSHYDFLEWRLLVEKAAIDRLLAERMDADEIDYSTELLSRSKEKEVAKILEVQNNLFKVRKDSIAQNISILNQRISQLEKQIDGLNAQKRSGQEQIRLIREELETAQKLLAKGLEQKPRILALQRTAAELDGRIGEYDASIARAADAINENKLQMISVKTERLKDTANESRESENRVASIEEELTKATDIYKRTVIVATRSGVVTNLKYHTVGGVITPGAAIMDIVPQNDELVIEAKLSPTDIDNIVKGQKTKVMLTSYQARFMPRLDAKVMDISPDKVTDEATHQSFYIVRVSIDKEAFKHLRKKIELYPGMPAQVFIVADSSTFMEYMFYPLKASMQKAFIESSSVK